MHCLSNSTDLYPSHSLGLFLPFSANCWFINSFICLFVRYSFIHSFMHSLSTSSYLCFYMLVDVLTLCFSFFIVLKFETLFFRDVPSALFYHTFALMIINQLQFSSSSAVKFYLLLVSSYFSHNIQPFFSTLFPITYKVTYSFKCQVTCIFKIAIN